MLSLKYGIKLLSRNVEVLKVTTAGLKHFPKPINYDDVEFAERPKLKFMDKVPLFPANLRPPKMQKNLKFMRGPETVHNTLLHKQYAIIATCGGRLRWGHFEMMRLGIGRKLDINRMFAIWRVDAPWQPLTKQGQGQRMGGGKGAVDHYVTPVKAGRVIIELGGHCEFKEVKDFMEQFAAKLPFRARVVSQDMLDREAAKEKEQEASNLNPYTFKYVIQNNLGGCHRWLSPVDHKWFGEYN
ncbi:unnamed protein product [Diamesa serratosioi]